MSVKTTKTELNGLLVSPYPGRVKSAWFNEAEKKRRKVLTLDSKPFDSKTLSRGGSRKFKKKGRVPHSPPRIKPLLQPGCIIITTLEKGLEGLGPFKNALKIQDKKRGRGPLGPSPKSAYAESVTAKDMRFAKKQIGGSCSPQLNRHSHSF